MPELSRFYGIVIQMYFRDHPPPHFHVVYGSSKAIVDIETLALIDGQLPPRARGLVTEWATIHQRNAADTHAGGAHSGRGIRWGAVAGGDAGSP